VTALRIQIENGSFGLLTVSRDGKVMAGDSIEKDSAQQPSKKVESEALLRRQIRKPSSKDSSIESAVTSC
jgi:hypothetical protein